MIRSTHEEVCTGLLIALALHAQVYSPRVLVKDQIDSSDLPGLVRGIYAQAYASTPREKAEAVWRSS